MPLSKTAKIWTTVGVMTAVVVTGGVAVATWDSGEDELREHATVIRVIDGDTVDVNLAGEETRVRLLNVDTPEMTDSNELAECLGPEATDFLADLLTPGQTIELEYDDEREDRYGRTLAGVFYGESLINADIAAAGLGVAVLYEPNDKFYQQVKDAEAQARENATGLFDPALECSLPQRIEALQGELDPLTEQIPEDIPGVEEALLAVPDLINVVDDLKEVLPRISDGEFPVLHSLYASTVTEHRHRLNRLHDDITSYENQLNRAKADIEAEEQRKKEEEERKKQEEEERKKQEEERKRQAEAERKKKEEEERKRQAEAEAELKKQEEERKRQAEAAERDQREAAERERQRQHQHDRGSSGGSHSGHRGNSGSSNGAPAGYGTDADYPGYTGPRCYAPGGRYWRPC